MSGKQQSNEIENASLRRWEAEARIRGGEGQVLPPACMWLTGHKEGNCPTVFSIPNDTFANQYLELLLVHLELQHYKSQQTWNPCFVFLLFIKKYELLCSEVIF